MAHKFDKVEFDGKKQAKQDHEKDKKDSPNPNSLPALVQRVKLLEKLLGV
jgi:hypothetical protein